jgi:hypothetical protein
MVPFQFLHQIVQGYNPDLGPNFARKTSSQFASHRCPQFLVRHSDEDRITAASKISADIPDNIARGVVVFAADDAEPTVPRPMCHHVGETLLEDTMEAALLPRVPQNAFSKQGL